MEITSEVLQQKHSAGEYLNWAKGLVADLSSTENGIEKVRLRQDFAKQLMEEMLPIGRFALNHFNASEDVYIELRLGNQNFDAIIHDEREINEYIEYLEVTSTYVVGASSGYEDFLFKHHLHHHGASGTGNISFTGSKFKGLKTELQREMISQESVIKHEQEMFQQAIDRKSKIKYPKNTALIISFNDLFAFDHQENIDNIINVFEKNKAKLDNFKLVAVVGYPIGLYLEYSIE